MQFFYGNQMPLRILDEIDFWKHQEAEHTVVIRELTPNLEKQYVDLLMQWEQVFSQTQAAAVRYIESVQRSGGYALPPQFYAQVMQLTQRSLQESTAFVEFLNEMAQGSHALKSNPTAITVLNHIRRESEYFIGIAQLLVMPPAGPMK